MAIEEVVVVIAPDGSVSIETTGFQGMKCRDATAALEKYLGDEVLDRNLTDEAFQASEANDQLNLGQNW
jgi:hypothetical protein